MPESPPSTPDVEKEELTKSSSQNGSTSSRDTPGKRDPTSARVIEGLKLLYHEKVRRSEVVCLCVCGHHQNEGLKELRKIAMTATYQPQTLLLSLSSSPHLSCRVSFRSP